MVTNKIIYVRKITFFMSANPDQKWQKKEDNHLKNSQL